MADFQIVAHGLPALATDWFQAQKLDDEDLPSLTDVDKQRARRRLLTDEQYQRHLAFRRFARERDVREAEALGRTMSSLLSELGSQYTLKSIERRGEERGWHVLIETCGEASSSIVEDVYVPDAEQPQLAANRMRSHLFTALGREDSLRSAS